MTTLQGILRDQQLETQNAGGTWRALLWQCLSMALALGLAGAVLVLLLWSPFQSAQPSAGKSDAPASEELVRLLGPRLIGIKPETPLEKKLTIAAVTGETVSAPMLTVTGSIVARLGSGKGTTEGRWDFNSPDLATAYADWIKARAEVPFAEKQLATIRELTKAQIEAQAEVVQRLKKLVDTGSEPLKDLVKEQAELRKMTLQGQKDEHEAETALKNAARTLATLERQLFQAGIDPGLLARAPEGTAIVVAEVPEARLGLAQTGQACVARFYAFPDAKFPGRVGSLAPTLARERRTLRVFFELNDEKGRLKPGMFADVGLGTDPREMVLVPADALVHVGTSDYVLVETEPGAWRVTEVKPGELHGTGIEVVSGVKPGDQVIGNGAILLKPFIIQALQDDRRP